MEDISQATEAFTQANDSQAAPERLEDTHAIYEIGYHVTPGTSEGEVGSVADGVRQQLLNHDAVIISEGLPQKTALAYPIIRSVSGKRETFTESYFGWIKYSASRDTTQIVKEYMRGLQGIIRSMVIETIRDDAPVTKRRAIFVSDRLEGATIQKPMAVREKSEDVSEEELDKSIEALTS